MNALGGLVAHGRSADVHSLTDSTVVKVFHDDWGSEAIDREVEDATAAFELGLTPIRCHGRTDADGRRAAIFDRIEGVALTTVAEKNPLRMGRVARALARAWGTKKTYLGAGGLGAGFGGARRTATGSQWARNMILLMGMQGWGEKKIEGLSKGMSQKVQFVASVITNPALLILDEPFSALDPVTRWTLQRQFLSLREELAITAVFVTHDIREALMLGSRIALLHDGMLELVASPSEFLNAKSPEAAAFLATLEGSPDGPHANS